MKKFKINNINAREILNSKGEPTIEVELQTDVGVFFAAVPSGTSTGKYEAKEIRDGGRRYGGKGVLKAISNIENIIAPKLKGKSITNQEEIDSLMVELDGKEDKSRLGANAILAVSMAACRAGAEVRDIPLYQYISQLAKKKLSKGPLKVKPCFLMIEGGSHAGNELDFQEFMIIPEEKSFSKNLLIGTEIYHILGDILKAKHGKSAVNVGLEGGFAPSLYRPEQALDLITEALKKSGYKSKVKIILDVAASEFYEKDKYKMKQSTFTASSLLNYHLNLIQKYNIKGLEDPFSEDDWIGWKELKALPVKQKGNVIAIGDDLLVTNIERIKKAIEEEACDGLIIKLNQIGTVTETIEASLLAQENDWYVFVKHRSGETNDDFIADLAVGLEADGIMTGAPARGERVAKYNRLLEIEEETKNL